MCAENSGQKFILCFENCSLDNKIVSRHSKMTFVPVTEINCCLVIFQPQLTDSWVMVLFITTTQTFVSNTKTHPTPSNQSPPKALQNVHNLLDSHCFICFFFILNLVKCWCSWLGKLLDFWVVCDQILNVCIVIVV